MKFLGFMYVVLSVFCFMSCFYEYAKRYTKDHSTTLQLSYVPYYEFLKNVFPVFSLVTLILVIVFITTSDLINPSKAITEGHTSELAFDVFAVITAVINYVMILKVKQEKTIHK